MSILDKSTFKNPETSNDKWIYTTIKEIIQSVKFGSVEFEITIQNGQAATIKEHSRKSHSYHND